MQLNIILCILCLPLQENVSTSDVLMLAHMTNDLLLPNESTIVKVNKDKRGCGKRH